jgi:hypothetical protein
MHETIRRTTDKGDVKTVEKRKQTTQEEGGTEQETIRLEVGATKTQVSETQQLRGLTASRAQGMILLLGVPSLGGCPCEAIPACNRSVSPGTFLSCSIQTEPCQIIE